MFSKLALLNVVIKCIYSRYSESWVCRIFWNYLEQVRQMQKTKQETNFRQLTPLIFIRCQKC